MQQTETKIDRHKICNKNSDKSTHIKIAVTEKKQYTQKLQQKLRENKKHIKIAKTQQNHTHTHKHTKCEQQSQNTEIKCSVNSEKWTNQKGGLKKFIKQKKKHNTHKW